MHQWQESSPILSLGHLNSAFSPLWILFNSWFALRVEEKTLYLCNQRKRRRWWNKRKKSVRRMTSSDHCTVKLSIVYLCISSSFPVREMYWACIERRTEKKTVCIEHLVCVIVWERASAECIEQTRQDCDSVKESGKETDRRSSTYKWYNEQIALYFLIVNVSVKYGLGNKMQTAHMRTISSLCGALCCTHKRANCEYEWVRAHALTLAHIRGVTEHRLDLQSHFAFIILAASFPV